GGGAEAAAWDGGASGGSIADCGSCAPAASAGGGEDAADSDSEPGGVGVIVRPGRGSSRV
ncbi:hypothetical protein, partial [Lysobacter enzymogenes]|uniref:hypothetical protein n=1 Tax=Lysobacter enzymogenes TaxID=69 RepID=UPI0019D28B9B